MVAEALEWVARSKGAQCLFHYIDDFIFVGPQSTDGCVRDLWAILQSCNELCVAVAPHKTEGAVTCLTVLGIEIDTGLMELRLPAGKLHCLSSLLAQWRGKRKADQDSVEEDIGNHGVLVRFSVRSHLTSKRLAVLYFPHCSIVQGVLYYAPST